MLKDYSYKASLPDFTQKQNKVTKEQRATHQEFKKQEFQQQSSSSNIPDLAFPWPNLQSHHDHEKEIKTLQLKLFSLNLNYCNLIEGETITLPHGRNPSQRRREVYNYGRKPKSKP